MYWTICVKDKLKLMTLTIVAAICDISSIFDRDSDIKKHSFFSQLEKFFP